MKLPLIPFSPRPRSHTAMDAGLENIIRRALEDARAKGQDYITQTGLAVKAAREARSDMTASDALAAVKMA
jgi:hypothetical protein